MRFLAVAGVLLVACALERAALAAGPVVPAEQAAGVDAAAARWLSKGNAAFMEGRFADAEEAYREAWAVKKGYDIAGNLGAAELAQGKVREAAQHLAFTLRMFPITGEPALREQMQRALDQCRERVGAVRVKLDVKGAQVLVDGAPAGEAPLLDAVFVDPGLHTFEAKLEGYTGAPRRVKVASGGVVELTLPLEPVPKRAIPLDEPAPRRRSPVPGIVLGAVAAAGFGAGAVFLGLEAARSSSAAAIRSQILADHQSCVLGTASYDASRCPGLQSTLRADDTFHNLAVGAFIVGGAAALGTGAFFLWPSKQPSRAGHALQVTPAFSAASSGIVLSGSF